VLDGKLARRIIDAVRAETSAGGRGLAMEETKGSTSGTGGKARRIGVRLAVILVLALLAALLAFIFLRFPGQGYRYETVLGNTAKVIEVTSRMRINLLKSTDLTKDSVMAVTDEESQLFARQSREGADAVERDYQELKALIDAAKIGKEMELLKEFGDSWTRLRLLDAELLSLAVENTNIKAAKLSCTAAAGAIANFKGLLTELMNVPASDRERAQTAELAFQAVTAAFGIYSLEAPHINEAKDQKMDAMEKVMAADEKKVREALHRLAANPDPDGRILLDQAVLAFEKFMEVHREVLRLSRMNTNIKSLELSLDRKRKAAARCEEVLDFLQETVQGRSFQATK
jgi:hypothetical protein